MINQDLLKAEEISAFDSVRELKQEDAYVVASLHLCAFPKTRSSLLGREFLTTLYRYHFNLTESIHLGIERKGSIVGIACGGQQGYQKRLFKKTMWAASYDILCRPWVLLRLFSTQQGPFPLADREVQEPPNITFRSLPAPIIKLRVLAVKERVRHSGCGSKLIIAFESRAKMMGACSILVSVSKANFVARHFYVRHGFSPIANEPGSNGIYYGKSLV